jgi:hypothetical protein
MQEAIAEILGRDLVGIFGLMEVAEEELARAGDSPGAFLLLRPTLNMSQRRSELYRAHCRELLQRLADGVKPGRAMAQATDAEIVLGLAATCERAPLRHEYAVVYQVCFGRIFPEKVEEMQLETELDLYERDTVLVEVRDGMRDRDREKWRPGKNSTAGEQLGLELAEVKNAA